METFRTIFGNESELESVDFTEKNLLLNFQDNLGRTALHYACYYGSIGVVEDLMFLKANPWLEDAYTKRPIDLIQQGPKYDVLIELLTNNMKISKNPIKNLFKAADQKLKSKGKRKRLLRSLDITDLKLIPTEKLIAERIGITFDSYMGFAIGSNKFDAVKYLLSLGVFDISLKNSSGFTYFHIAIVDQRMDLLKLLFLRPSMIQEPFDSKEEINSDVLANINPEIFTKSIFEISSNKNNTILNCCVEYGTPEMFRFLFTIFIEHYSKTEEGIAESKRLIDIEDKNGHSPLIKCILKDQSEMVNEILLHKHIIKEQDLFQIADYLEGSKSTKLGSAKQSKRCANVDQKKQIGVFVNRIWDYLKNKDVEPLKAYIEQRADTILESQSEIDRAEIVSQIVNEQKRGSLFTPLHFAIKYKNLSVIRCLIYDYNADTSIENKDGHDPIEYLHLGDINSSRFGSLTL